jgi:predicted enzyme related to lactoylglutathione lyase
MGKMDSVVHFEMPYEDGKRLSEFYSKAFGWQLQTTGPEMGEYIVAHTTETDPQTRMVKTPGHINGGFYPKKSAPPEPSVVIAVDDIKESMKKVEASGGKILGVMDHTGKRTMEPQEIPGIGLWMTFQDTEGNRVSMLQPKGM